MKRPTKGVATSFKHEHPEWADLAYEVLYRRDQHAEFDLQYVVAQALLVAYTMGLEGKFPPRPAHLPPRRHEPPPPDPEIDAIAREMMMLAWSPLAGTPKPDGHFQWALAKYMEREQRKAAKQAPKKPVVVARRQAPAPAPSKPVVVVRRR